ncbi:MAG TPA: N-acetylmuramoyl-L-alanine amidase [Anaerolineae bacterium]|nr:N-acetylmuramoyl-L-alanine amidase [Anaerolineae bacterium]
MNLFIVKEIRNKYDGLPRNPDEIDEIVIHGTGGGTAKGIIKWMSSDTCERKENYKKSIGLFHYEIDRNGDIYEIMHPDYRWAYHSGSGKHDRKTIGIELVNPSAGNKDDYTDEQYDSLIVLIKKLTDSFEVRRIVSHDFNRKKYSNIEPKPCPGPLFDWNRIAVFPGIDIFSGGN